MKYLKYMCYLFGLLMLLNLPILLPYYSSEVNHNRGSFHISDYSILSLMDSPSSRFWLPFLFVVINSMLGFAAVYAFWQVSMQVKHSGERKTTLFGEKEIAMHSLLIKGIPDSIPYELAQKEVSDMLYESYPSDIL
jgi:hypothetical protein